MILRSSDIFIQDMTALKGIKEERVADRPVTDNKMKQSQSFSTCPPGSGRGAVTSAGGSGDTARAALEPRFAAGRRVVGRGGGGAGAPAAALLVKPARGANEPQIPAALPGEHEEEPEPQR